jgi:hypothetical protein
MAEHPARRTAASTAPGTSLPPQAPRPFRPSEPAPPSGPAGLSVAANRLAAVSRPWPALSRHSRGRRLLLVGAAATGIWLLCGLSHSASAHADAVSPQPAVPSVSTVVNQPTGLPAGQPATKPALPGPARRAQSGTAQVAATGRLTLRRLPTPPALPGTSRTLPVPEVAVPVPVIAVPVPVVAVPVPVPVVAVPVPPILGLPVLPVHLPAQLIPPTPMATGHPPPAGAHSADSDGLAAEWGRTDPHAFVRPSVARHSIQRSPAGPATPAPLPRPVPGSPDGPRPALIGSGTSARDGRYLPLVVLPARTATGQAIRPNGRQAGDGAGPRDSACRPDVSPD